MPVSSGSSDPQADSKASAPTVLLDVGVGHIGATRERGTPDNHGHWRSTLASVDQALTMSTQASRAADSLSYGKGRKRATAWVSG
jgi:hypothetical protein